MKIAFARAGMWFFGAVLTLSIILLMGLSDDKKNHVSEHLPELCAGIGAIALVIASTIFFTTWYDILGSDRDHELAKRQAEADTLEEERLDALAKRQAELDARTSPSDHVQARD